MCGRRVAVVVAVLSVLAPASAEAAPIELGVQDDPLVVRLPSAFGGFGADRLLAPARVHAALDALRVDTVRINVPWAQVSGGGPGQAPQLGLYEAAVDRVRADGRRVQLTLSGPAPRWATGDGRESAYAPSARRYAEFARAVAARFRGRVARYSIWNEPNWWSLLRPRRHAARIYRRMFLRGAAAIRSADPAARVLIGELAPLGQPEAATPPLRFLRRLTCSDRRWRRVRACPRLVADGFAHHPYSLRWPPEYPGPGRDDVTTGSLWRLNHALGRLARRGALATPAGRALPLYLTEWGYHARSTRVREPQRSAFVRRGLRLAARTRRVRQVVWYQLAGPPKAAHAGWDTGLLGPRGTPRPVFRAVRGWSRARAKRPRPPVALPAAAPGRGTPVPRAAIGRGGLLAAAAHPAGDGVITWFAARRRWLSRTRGGRFARPRAVARIRSGNPFDAGRVAVGRGGDAVIGWTYNDHSIVYPPLDRMEDCCDRVRAAVVTRRGRRRVSRTLSPGGSAARVTDVASGPRHRFAIAWVGRGDRAWVNVGDLRRGFEPRERVPRRADGSQVVATWFRGGRLHVLTHESGRLLELRRRGRGRWSPPRERLDSVSRLGALEVRTAPDGRQVALARRRGWLSAAFRRPGRRFVVQRLTRRAGDMKRLSLAPDGTAAVALGGFLKRRIRVAVAAPGRRFGRLRELRAGAGVEDLGVGAGPGGRAAVTWLLGQRGARFVPELRGAVVRAGRRPSRPNRLARRPNGTLTPADGGPVFRRRVPLLVYNDDGAVTTTRVR